MKYTDDNLEWHDENELVRKLDVVEAVLNMADSLEEVVDILMTVPSVDAEDADMVRVVRCKECKKANTEDCSHSYWDDDWGEWRVGYRGDEWFCADGEREGE